MEDTAKASNTSFDYSFVPTKARVAVYDDPKMAPRIIDIDPAPTAEYIEKLADCVDEQKRKLGGKIPYSAIREMSENFIHAQFSEVVVSILDEGNTIRFCDQGPGITNKEKATLPGFTSAIEPMKQYIRGVGSGLPLVKEYLDISHGSITIEDNLTTGAVVTLSMKEIPAHPTQIGFTSYNTYTQPSSHNVQLPHTNNYSFTPTTSNGTPIPPLSDREKMALTIFAHEGAVGVSELSQMMNIAMSSTYALMVKLEQNNLIETVAKKKRILTDYGDAVYQKIAEI